MGCGRSLKPAAQEAQTGFASEGRSAKGYIDVGFQPMWIFLVAVGGTGAVPGTNALFRAEHGRREVPAGYPLAGAVFYRPGIKPHRNREP